MDRHGSKGGKATFRKYGVEHFRELGKKGIKAVADRYFHGSIPDAMVWLRSRAAEFKIAQGVDEKLQRQIDAGAEMASEELPVFCEPDCDPSYWRDRVRESQNEREFDLPF